MERHLVQAPGPSKMTPEQVISVLRLDPVAFVSDIVRSHGDIAKLPLGSQSLFILSNPEYIRQIFVVRPDIFKKRHDEAAEDAYLSQMAGFSPMFDTSLMPGYARVMSETAQRAEARWREALPVNGTLEVDIYREMMRMGLEIVGRTLFQVDLHDESAELVDALLRLNFGYGFDPLEANLGPLMPAAERVRLTDHEAARNRVHGFMRGLFDSVADQPEEQPPLISTLLQYVGPDHAVGVAVGTMVAMHEVTVTTLAWTWYLLSQYPEVDAALHAELSRVLGGRAATYEDLPNLAYTEMVLAEARRLYPSVWMVLRFVREDTAFDDHAVPAGSVVMASAQLMHRDPRFFPEPYRFDPLRWTQEAGVGRPEYAYFPFSEGPRACAGEEFAKMQDVILLATLAQHWRPQLVPGQQFQPRVQKSNAPRPGIRMTLQPSPLHPVPVV